MIGFWAEITKADRISHEDTMISGLIDSHSYLLMDKFITHTICGRNKSTKVMPDELFLMWCMAINRRGIVHILCFILCGVLCRHEKY